MLAILSPSKTLDTQSPLAIKEYSAPTFLAESEKLVKKLRGFSEKEIAEFMEISPKLATLNAQRFADFHTPFTPKNARPALLTFKGDVYEGMEVASYKKADFTYAQKHLRILSGLYGLLRPLDLMQPYRLEMGRKLAIGKHKDLYDFWGSRITAAINDALHVQPNKLLINLASQEYAKAVDKKSLEYPMVTVDFKEEKDGKLKTIGLFAKRARGMMADYLITQRIDRLEGLYDFTRERYRLNRQLSSDSNLIFTRKAS